ncbi:Glucose/arabinose dehydrogenase, beta-propeller fold [Virgibacillus subterraneus]|uniref:Glucose/arabinose dehydrogenase, beta-propeller fold n=1 Tax=Virgibacillus subterraneus TaxID=621109 RepID=A0A1H9IPI9_9BACI|nr:PQQ-dependent sugar dehydrogenase [Virgibacillus subterraneus]SEQ76466.1 Glucose/arabinose dehydrogenase, beta-propeller fold [Virgibacillus subterraneus]
MTRYLIIIFTFMFIASACSQDEERQQQSDEAIVDIPNTEGDLQVIAKNLQEPWEIAKLNDAFYVSERIGSIVTIKRGEQTRKQVQFSKDLSNQAEAGLLGIAVPGNFSETNKAFAYYSYQEDNQYYQRVVTIKESDEQWEETSVLIDRIPGGQFHQGGRIEIGPDNKLYITTGDATQPELAQDLDSLAGKILRMNLDGSIPADNPFEDSYVFTFGHRNPQGMAWNEADEMFATEHGSSAHDEINRIIKGSNYGWPEIQGDETAANMESPIIHSGENTWAPSGMTYHNGFFYFASLRGEGLRRFDPANKTQKLIVSNVGRVRDALATNEGIYFLTNNTDGRGDPAANDDRLLFLPYNDLD